jgi:hypothetical protein
VDTGAVSITAIVASPTGDDGALGVPSAPFRTMSHALSVGQSGDTLQLQPGTFGSSAETFPASEDAGAYACNIHDGLLIAGLDDAGANPQLLDEGDGGGVAPLVPCGSTTLSNLDVQGFAYGIVVTHGSVTLQNVHQAGAANDGVYVSGSNALLTLSTAVGSNAHSTFQQNGGAGLHLVNHASLTAGGFDVTGNAGDGLDVEDGLTTSVRFAHLDQNQGAGLRVSGNTLLNVGPTVEINANGHGLVLQDLARVATVDGTFAEQNVGDGIAVLGRSAGLTLTNSFVDANFAGLHVETDGGTVGAVNTTLVTNQRGLLVRGAPTSVNLNAVSAGSDTVQGNQVNVDVDVPATTLVTLRGVVFDGTDGGAFPDAETSGGERRPWVMPAATDDGGLLMIDANGLTQSPLMWDPDAGEGPFNYLLWDGGGHIQF